MAETPKTALSVILDELAPLEGQSVLDIGCGKGGLRDPLTEAGAIWRGLDPFLPEDVPQADKAKAESMPYPDNHFDHAICVNALHHIPLRAMARALTEAARVLRPGGRLVVIEPYATGSLSKVIAVVDDETEIRAAAQRAMDTTTALEQIAGYDYPRVENYADFDAFCATLIAVDPARAPEIDAQREALLAAFQTEAKRGENGWSLSQPMSVRVLTPA